MLRTAQHTETICMLCLYICGIFVSLGFSSSTGGTVSQHAFAFSSIGTDTLQVRFDDARLSLYILVGLGKTSQICSTVTTKSGGLKRVQIRCRPLLG